MCICGLQNNGEVSNARGCAQEGFLFAGVPTDANSTLPSVQKWLSALPVEIRIMKTRALWAPLIVIACCVQSNADPVVAPDIETPILPEVLRQLVPTAGPAFEPDPFVWGEYILSPHFLDRFYYANGLQSEPGVKSNSYVDSVAPGLLMDIGSHWTFDYTPTWTFYSSRRFHDTVDESLVLAGAWSYRDTDLQFSQNYVTNHAPLIETGMQTYQQTYATIVDLTHHYTGQVSLEVVFDQNISFVSPPPDYYDWTLTEWLHYRFLSGIDVAGGVAEGYTLVHPGTDMDFFQPQARISFPLGKKLSFDVHAGDEEREFLSHPASYLNSPIFGATARYQPFDDTTVSLNADHEVSTSFFVNQVTEDTDWNVHVEQKILQHFTLSGGAAYTKSRYLAATVDTTAGREDYTYSYDIRLSTTFLRRGTLAGFYQYTQNWSNTPGFSFASSQIGCEVGFKY
jgi:hypothetical protein